jgi:hypothetical protein
MPTTPLLMEAIKETLVCVLKFIFRINMVRGIIANAFTISTKPMTLITSTKTGSLKKALIAGETKNKRI